MGSCGVQLRSSGIYVSVVLVYTNYFKNISLVRVKNHRHLVSDGTYVHEDIG